MKTRNKTLVGRILFFKAYRNDKSTTRVYDLKSIR